MTEVKLPIVQDGVQVRPLWIIGYCITTAGQVLSSRWGFNGRCGNSWKTRKAFPDKYGYLRVKLCEPGKKPRWYKVHKLVLETFVGPCPVGQEARHLDDDKNNVDLSNLCYGTPKENSADRIRNGKQAHGNRHGRRKLLAEQVIEIRIRLANGEHPKTLAVEFVVTVSLIHQIGRHVIWKSLGGPVTKRIRQ